MASSPLPPYPRGWYAVGLTSELAAGSVRSRPFMTARLVLFGLARGAQQDFRIWGNKRYLEQPALAAGDGPIGIYRRWARQFYEEPAGTVELPAAEPLAAAFGDGG